MPPVKSSGKAATFLVAGLFFAALLALLYLRRDEAAAVFPLLGLIFFWCDWRGERELPILFVFLGTVAGIVAAARGPAAARPALAAEIAGLWVLSGALSSRRRALLDEALRVEAELAELGKRTRELERDLSFYEGRSTETASRVRLRRDLTESAKSLGASWEGREVREKLVSILNARFPGSRVELRAQEDPDPLLDSARAGARPILVPGPLLGSGALGGDPAQGLSAMVVPMRVEREPAGFVKIVSGRDRAFTAEDLRSADLLATLAGLSLENIALYKRIHSEAMHDPLTQLFSRRAFDERIHEEILSAGRSRMPLSLILMDIDHFKTYNDRYGHQAGDELLRRVSAAISGAARPVDTAARYGGEEFCLLLPHLPYAQALERAEALRRRVMAETFVFKGQQTRVTLSLGVAAFPEDAILESQLVRAADERLYKAKASGRNKAVGRP